MIERAGEERSDLLDWENEGGPPAAEPQTSGTSSLDWSAFSARFFPHAQRHDVGPLKAYETYLNRRRAA
jgi:hypothetical protein